MAPATRLKLIATCLDSASAHVDGGMRQLTNPGASARVESAIVEALAALETALALVRMAPRLRLVATRRSADPGASGENGE